MNVTDAKDLAADMSRMCGVDASKLQTCLTLLSDHFSPQDQGHIAGSMVNLLKTYPHLRDQEVVDRAINAWKGA